MDLYETLAGALILIVSAPLPAFTALRAGYRQHSRWLIIPYVLATAFFLTYLQGVAPQSHDPQSLNFGDGFVFVVGLVVFGGPGAIIYVIAGAAGKFKEHIPSWREQAVHLAVFVGLLGLGTTLIHVLKFSPFL